MKRTPIALALALAAAIASPAWSLDLARAYALAVEQDAQIRAARAAADAGRERLPQARAQLLPSVSAQAARARNNLETTSPDFLGNAQTTTQDYNSSSQSLSLRQPLIRPGLWAQYRQAGHVVQEAEAQLARDMQELVTRVTQAYLQALLAQDQLAVIRQQKAAYTAQLDAARRSLAAGSGTRTDVDEALARLDMARAQELEANQGLDLARRELQVLVNQPVDALAPVDAARLAVVPPQPDSLEAWTQRAEEASAEMRVLRARLAAAREEVAKAQSGHLPTLDATAQLSRSTSENLSRINTTYSQRQIGLQLNIPLYQGGYVNSQVREALASQERAENVLEAQRRDLGVRVHREYRGMTEGVLRVRALEQAVRSATELVTSSKRSFEAGVRTRLDILNAEQQLAVAQRDLAQARYVYLASKARLLALAGQPGEAVVAEISAALAPAR